MTNKEKSFIELNQIEAAKDIGAKIIELHTGEYCNSEVQNIELDRIIKAAEYAFKNNIEVHVKK